MNGLHSFIWMMAIALHIVISLKFGSIAEDKGYTGQGWWCFLFGFIGWIMVLALPDKSITKKIDNLIKKVETIANNIIDY